MIQEFCRVVENAAVARDTFVLSFESPTISRAVLPGQFVNVRAWAGTEPFLRRPFSVYRTEGERVSLVFNTVGKGTRILSELTPGQTIDVLGPLGTPFGFNTRDFDNAFLVGGGLGVAPLPILSDALTRLNIPRVTLLGARTSAHLIPEHLEHPEIATDDGSLGFRGTVVDLARRIVQEKRNQHPKIFGCGPTPMLRALSQMATELEILCEISLEGPMGCGFGICQGCPVRLRNGKKEYALMCREGPVFAADQVEI